MAAGDERLQANDGGSQFCTNQAPGDGAGYLSAEIDNDAGYPLGVVEATIDLSASPGVGNSIKGYFIQDPSDSSYEDGSSSVQPAKPPDFTIPLRNVTTSQRIARHGIELPEGKFKILLWNDTGQSIDTSGLNAWLYRYGRRVLQS